MSAAFFPGLIDFAPMMMFRFAQLFAGTVVLVLLIQVIVDYTRKRRVRR